MTAQQLSKKLADAGFARSTWSEVKGSGRSRRTNGFEVSAFDGAVEVSVKHFDQTLVEKVYATVIELGFAEVKRTGATRTYTSAE